MRSPRSRRWTAPRRSCRCCPASPSARPTTTSAHGTSSLYAALDITTGKVIGSLHARHRAIEFKKFLQTSTGGPRRARRAPRPRQLLHPQDTGDQALAARAPPVPPALHPHQQLWLNLVERWFAELTTKKLRRGAHRSVRELNADIRAWIDTWNENPAPTSGPRPPTRSSNPSAATATELTHQDTRRPRLATRYRRRALSNATGLSHVYCWLIRLGKRVPHQSHWPALAALTGK